ncbi:hypothetical protein B0H14DRAFT_3430327 [Mycena olivaceomarginata]|nr:hypothetical protein B0H14DRAFT_3430327 [Mycena olivaceomarginata]
MAQIFELTFTSSLHATSFALRWHVYQFWAGSRGCDYMISSCLFLNLLVAPALTRLRAPSCSKISLWQVDFLDKIWNQPLFIPFWLACQPLSTIKVRMQLSKSGRAPGGPRALYKGLGAILSGIVPKMPSRFGTTEAIAVVTPTEVVKIRLQAQMQLACGPAGDPRHWNAGHAVYTIVWEEGIGTLY